MNYFDSNMTVTAINLTEVVYVFVDETAIFHHDFVYKVIKSVVESSMTLSNEPSFICDVTLNFNRIVSNLPRVWSQSV